LNIGGIYSIDFLLKNGLSYLNIQYSIFISYGALTTCPDLMQLVQTSIFLTLPFEIARTRCRFGLNRRFVTLWAWLILLPTIGFLPHISHTLDMLALLDTNRYSDKKADFYTNTT